VSDIESTGKVNGRTYVTVQYYKQHYKHVIICIGSDKLYELERWYMAEELMQETRVLLFTRGETLEENQSEFIKKHRGNILEIEFDYPGISSSMIRELYEGGRLDEIKEHVPYPVYEYLYKTKSS
jgi:nicotinic acid mononucleotide adenylyltransferase